MTNHDQNDRLDQILAAYLQAVDGGTAPSRAEFLASFPDLAEDLAAALEAMEVIGGAARAMREHNEIPTGAGLRDPRPTLSGGRTVRYFGDYELVEEIARGGMGVVFHARQVSLNRSVALKMILDSALASDEAVQRFLREARAAASLDHENIVDIYEVGEHEGHRYFTMQLLTGGNLAQDMAARVGDQRGAVDLMRAIARAVDHGHRRGILHRDLKPANILLDDKGAPRVCDFGLALQVAQAGDLTRSGAVLGTPSYMAPEQAAGRSDDLTVATDVWSLGAILHELLTGRPPFTGATPLETVRKVLDADLPRPGVSRDLDTILMKCLQRDPEKRYHTAAAFADDLDRWSRGEPITARPVGAAELVWMWARRRPAVAALLAVSAVAVVVILGGGAVFLKRERDLRIDTETNLTRARALGLAAASHELASGGDATAALILAREAVRYQADTRTERRLRAALDAPPAPRAVFAARYSAFGDFVFTRDGKGVLAIEGRWMGSDNSPRLFGPHAEELAVFRGHDKQVRAAAVSPDDSKFLTAAEDRTVRLWDRRGKQLLVVRGKRAGNLVRFSPDGNCFLTNFQNQDDIAQLWNLNGRQIASLAFDDLGGVAAMDFAPDGSRILCVTLNRFVLVWDRQGKPSATFRLTVRGDKQSTRPILAKFTPDGSRILTSAPGAGLVMWSLAGHRVAEFQGHEGDVLSFRFAPDGRTVLTASADNTARLFDLAGREIATLRGHQDQVTTAEFSSDGTRIVTGCEDGSCRVWDRAGRQVDAWQVSEHAIRAARFGPDGHAVFTTSEFTADIKRWDRERRGTLVSRTSAEVRSAMFAADGERVLVACDDASLRALDRAGEEKIAVRPQMASDVFAVLGDVEPVVVMVADGGPVFVKERKSLALSVLSGHTDRVLSIDLSADGQSLVTGSRDGTARLWTRAGEPGAILRGHPAAVSLVAFGTDRVLTVAGDHKVRVFDHAGKPVTELTGHTDRIVAATFDGSGRRVLTASVDRTARVWNPDGTQAFALPVHDHAIHTAVFGPDGIIATGTLAGVVRLFDAAGREVKKLPGPAGTVRDLRFSKDCEWLLVLRHDDRVEVHHRTRSISHTVSVPDDQILFVRFAGSAHRFVLFTRKGRARRVTGLDDGDGVVRWQEKPMDDIGFRPVGVAISRDGRTAFVSGRWYTYYARYDMTKGSMPAAGVGGRPIASSELRRGPGPRVLLREHPDTRLLASDGEQLARVRGQVRAVSPDGTRLIVTSTKGKTRMLDLAGNPVAEFIEDDVSAALFERGGKRVFCGFSDGAIRLLGTSGGAPVVFRGHSGEVTRIATSADGTRLVSFATDGTCRLWHADGRNLTVFGEAGANQIKSSRGRERIHVAEFAGDSSRLLTGSSRGVLRVHDRDGGLLHEIDAHRNDVCAAAFSPDGDLIVSADIYGKVIMWTADGHEVAKLLPHTGWVASIDFSADGRRVLTASWDDTVHVSWTRTEDLLALADRRIWRDLTPRELARYDDLLSDHSKQRVRTGTRSTR